jgi:hypothetical protein
VAFMRQWRKAKTVQSEPDRRGYAKSTADSRSRKRLKPPSAADEATILRSWPLALRYLGVMEPDLSIVRVATSGSGH